ncbi:MAG: sulfatase [Rhodothermales bacterium]
MHFGKTIVHETMLRMKSALLLLSLLFLAPSHAPQSADPPNILFVIGDDWSWLHVGAYGDTVVQTPNLDRLAEQGVVFEHAYVSSPSCTPSRAAVLTGQHFWRLEGGANLYGPLPAQHPTYVDLMENAGYHVGYTRKGWAPGHLGERTRNPAGPRYTDFDAFLQARRSDAPFVFWFGTSDPHRPYDTGSGAASGIDLGAVDVPAVMPDHVDVRGDIADYYVEIQRIDREVGEMVDQLEAMGELDNTLIVITSDNGMPFPRAKSNLYDLGVRVPLIMAWADGAPAGRRIDNFVSLTDLAPTFLDLAGLNIPDVMTGRSLLPMLQSEAAGLIESGRDAMFFGKERHVPSQRAPDSGGYPMRAIRTADYLYIRNFRPDRAPVGIPDYENAFLHPSWYGDTDGGPAKRYMVYQKDRDTQHQRLFDLAFGPRQGEELYDLRTDPDQVSNVASDPDYNRIKRDLHNRLMTELHATGDPRVQGRGNLFDWQAYTGGTPTPPNWQR